ncbi:hypothetical protein AB0F17_08795 [Nonomuraea sp. NPDC026600]|uniref:hypothetical protein n=1 Tax=Nonomuraea sp. NPDC026600 TaxID=3155363 RepID=UPI0033F6667E
MRYLPGEKIRVTVEGTVGEVVAGDPFEGGWPELLLDVKDDRGGVTLRIPPGWESVQIERLAPTGGWPRPREVWQDGTGSLWWVAYNERGLLAFCDGQGNFCRFEDLNTSAGPLTQVYPPATDEPSVNDEVPW